MLKHHKKKVVFTNIFCVSVAIVMLVIFYFIYASKSHLKQEITPKEFAEISAKVMFIPDGSAVKEQYKIFFSDNVINYAEYYALHNEIKDYENNIRSQLENKIGNSKTLNAYEKAVQNLKAYDEIGFELVAPSKRDEVRALMVEHIEKEKLKLN